MPSHVIRDVAYAEERNELTVTLASGRVYVFALVPPEVFRALAEAASKGAFFNARVRDRYPYRRARSASAEPASSLREALLGSR